MTTPTKHHGTPTQKLIVKYVLGHLVLAVGVAMWLIYSFQSPGKNTDLTTVVIQSLSILIIWSGIDLALAFWARKHHHPTLANFFALLPALALVAVIAVNVLLLAYTIVEYYFIVG